MKLYTVTVEAEFVCLAQDEIGAEYAAREALSDGSGVEFRASPLRYLPMGWDGGELPWTDEDCEEKTVNEWIASGAAPELVARMAKVKAERAAKVAHDSSDDGGST